MNELARIEAVLDDPALAEQLSSIEAALPIGVRPRQCSVRTLFVGLLGCLAGGHQSAHLVAAHAALVGLPASDRERLGVVVATTRGPHLLTYRQLTYTAASVVTVLAKERPDGGPSANLQSLCDTLVEASVPAVWKHASSSYALDWTDVASFSRPPSEPDGPCADPEAGWGRRTGDAPGQGDEPFFGYYGSLMTMTPDEGADAVPELVRRARLASCRHDPVPGFVTVVQKSAACGVVVHDVLADIGYSYRRPEHFALPLRSIGVRLVVDLHPNDRGTKGTHAGAICCNGNLYCPATPVPLLGLGSLARGASTEQRAAHDERSAELARYKLGRLTSDDADGYHRVGCPATLGKVRCPLREDSMALPVVRPQVLDPPETPPRCCIQRSVTVPPEVNAKTRQKHDYPGAAYRRSYARRTAAERSNSRLKDPAGINLDVRGWCKLMGVVPLGIFFACACVVVNFGLIDAFEGRLDDQSRSAAPGGPRPRQRRRRTLADLATATGPTP